MQHRPDDPIQIHDIFDLANDFYYGRNRKTDFAEAARLHRLAAEQGHSAAQRELGKLYLKGYGVEVDWLEAVRLFRLAAEQADGEAMKSLADCYKSGWGVEKDEVEAVRLYRLAAEQGHAWAMSNLADCYEKGEGVEKDLKEALKWYHLAFEQGANVEEKLQQVQVHNTNTNTTTQNNTARHNNCPLGPARSRKKDSDRWRSSGIIIISSTNIFSISSGHDAHSSSSSQAS